MLSYMKTGMKSYTGGSRNVTVVPTFLVHNKGVRRKDGDYIDIFIK